MSGRIQLSSIIALAKKPITWVAGLIVAGAGAIGSQYITQLSTGVATFLSEKTSEKACQLRQNPIEDDSQFKILVSPLSNDPDEKHTNRVMTAFGGERGFRVFPICESLKLIYKPGTDTRTSEEEVLQRGRDLIKSMHADLLLFGNVEDLDHSLRIYAINEHGGCDFHPKQTVFPYDSLLDRFNEEEKKKLFAVSLEEIAAACLNQPSIDWPLFAKRIDKMEKYVSNLPSFESEDPALFSRYADGMFLLYSHDQGDNWFSKDKSFILKVIDVLQSRGSDKGLRLMWVNYGELLDARSGKNSNIDDNYEAFVAFEKAINLDPKNAEAYNSRGYAYSRKGDLDRAIKDFDTAISLLPKQACGCAYHGRGYAYLTKGDPDRAIEDYDKAIDLNPKNSAFYTDRGDAYSAKGEVDHAIKDFDKAIGLAPKYARGYAARGDAHLTKGDFDRAIEDLTKAISLNPKDATNYDIRGYAYKARGEFDRAIEDYTKAIGLAPKVARFYGNRGSVYLRMGDWGRAIEDTTKAIGLDPKGVFAYVERGKAYRAKRDTRRAMADFNKAIGLDPKDITDFAVRADAYRAKGDIKHAFADFRKALGLNPQ